MKELQLSISTGKEDTHRVSLVAVFENHAEAVAFFSPLAKLCDTVPAQERVRNHNVAGIGTGLLQWRGKGE